MKLPTHVIEAGLDEPTVAALIRSGLEFIHQVQGITDMDLQLRTGLDAQAVAAVRAVECSEALTVASAIQSSIAQILSNAPGPAPASVGPVV